MACPARRACAQDTGGWSRLLSKLRPGPRIVRSLRAMNSLKRCSNCVFHSIAANQLSMVDCHAAGLHKQAMSGYRNLLPPAKIGRAQNQLKRLGPFHPPKKAVESHPAPPRS